MPKEGARALLHVFRACAIEVIKRSESSEFSCVLWRLERAKTDKQNIKNS
jgi:hypothetical protein